jgi:hypothetical protein
MRIRTLGMTLSRARRRGDEEAAGGAGAGSEAHITPGDEDTDVEASHYNDKPLVHGGQENPIHASTEYVNGRNDIKDVQRKEEKTDTPV